MSRDIKLVYWNYEDVGGTMTYAFDQYLAVTQGRESLIQNIVKNILTLKGSNVFDLTVGSSFSAIPGSAQSVSETDLMKTSLVLAIRTLEDDIKKRQKLEEDSGASLADNEKLQKILLRSTKFIISTGQWKITLDIYTNDESVTTISLPL
jgi:hypothetical protein